MGLLSQVVGQSNIGGTLPRIHLLDTVHGFVGSETGFGCSDRPSLTSVDLSLPTILIQRGPQRKDTQMAPEPRNDTMDMTQLLWNNTVLTEVGNVSSLNRKHNRDMFVVPDSLGFMVIVSVLIFICLCGMVGNGIVICLLGFCLKRNPYGVYILNLSIADFTYMAAAVLDVIDFLTLFSRSLLWFSNILSVSSYLVGLNLLMAISIERCVSVLWPIWYKCHRPVHLSTIVCALIWVLFLIFWFVLTVFTNSEIEDVVIVWLIYGLMSLPTFLVLLVSSLTLFIRVQCYSQHRQPSKLYWTILLNVLAFLLLSVPRGVFLAYSWAMYSVLFQMEIWSYMTLLSAVNRTVNPIIYFFVGRHCQLRGKKTLREVLQRALMDEEETTEHHSQIEQEVP